MKANPVVHFEMPFENKDRMTKFYTDTFGWKMENMGEEMGNYVVATTTEMDSKTKFPKTPGSINGGFFPKSKENSIPTVVIAVDDIQVAMDNVKAAGGEIIKHPVDIPGVGSYVGFIDTEGNRVAMLQPLGM